MKKITIELSINEVAAIKNLKYKVGYLEHNYFWMGLVVNHNVLPSIIDLDNIVIKESTATIHYHAKNKSDLVN